MLNTHITKKIVVFYRWSLLILVIWIPAVRHDHWINYCWGFSYRSPSVINSSFHIGCCIFRHVFRKISWKRGGKEAKFNRDLSPNSFALLPVGIPSSLLPRPNPLVTRPLRLMGNGWEGTGSPTIIGRDSIAINEVGRFEKERATNTHKIICRFIQIP